MTQGMWHTQKDGDVVTLARVLPARFDVSATASFPMLARTRLAHQIRQDMWRALRNIRGYSPVVRVERCDTGLRVTAGGRVPQPISKHIAERVESLLSDEDLRARWIKCAKLRVSG